MEAEHTSFCSWKIKELKVLELLISLALKLFYADAIQQKNNAQQ